MYLQMLCHVEIYLYFLLTIPRPPHPSNNTQGARGTGPQQIPPLDFSKLDGIVQHYIDCSIAPATRSAYQSAQRRYGAFCSRFGIWEPYPLREDKLCRFVVFLASEVLKHRTIKSYLSGLRFANISQEYGNPFKSGAMPRLEYVLGGIKRREALTGVPLKPRLPITIEVMEKLKRIWIPSPNPHPDNVMLWAASCVGFFGFLRSGEFTVPSQQGYDPTVHLSLADVAFNSHVAPSFARLRIKMSKTDPFRLGVDVFIGATSSGVCPITALLQFIEVRSSAPGPLFVFRNWQFLTRAALISNLQAALQKLCLVHTNYNGHSFRIGAATTAAQSGIEDSLIQTLRRWKSEAYKIYTKIPQAQLASVSRALTRRRSVNFSGPS